MRRRYRFLRSIGADPLTAAFIAGLNELSNLPAHEVGFMHIVWSIDPTPTEAADRE